jgi:predicted nucleotidyltransferase
MNNKDYETARTLKERLSGVVGLVDFRVFGSRARGDEDEYSDLDVFVEVEQISRQLSDIISDIVWETGFENNILISPLIFTRDDIENSPMGESPIVINVMRQGIRV